MRSRAYGGRDLERALRDPDGLGGDGRPAAIERPHREIEAVALLADPVRGRDADPIERELRGRAAADAHLVLDAGDAEALGRHLDDEARQSPMARRVRIGHGEDRDELGDRALADEPLRARDDVVVAVADGRGAGRGGIGAGLGLGQRERDESLARGEAREPAGLLLRGAGEEQRQRAELLHGQDQPGRGARAAQLLDREADAQELATETAVLDRERQGEDVVRGEELLEVLREGRGPVDLGGSRGDPLVGKDPDGVTEVALLPR